jgi:diguanylate cyclase (GGDEF)-like protein
MRSAISDPLSGTEPGGGARARARLRLAGAGLLGAGAVTIVATLAAPDPDPSDRRGLLICAAVFALVALGLAAWRQAPDLVLRAICPLGTVATTVTVALAAPVGLTPIFYLWPMVLAAYFLSRREVAINFAFALAACALALAAWVPPPLRESTFIAVAAIVGVVTGVVFSLREEIRKLVTRLGELATRDSLTGALNRGAFEQRLEAELARASRTEAPLALVVLDVDHFKRINDSQGHAAGDHALRALSSAVMIAKRRSDIFGRIGGEEFAIALPDTGIAGAEAFAEGLRESLRPAVGGVSLTVSLGVTDAVTADRSVRGMLHSADLALYAAKHAGRDRVVRADAPRREVSPAPRAV